MIELKNVSKSYKKRIVLENVSYRFEKGKIYGIYGINGSGKTMLLKLISGLVFPTNGSISIMGKVLHKDISFPESIGIVIENMELLPNLTAYENLHEISKIKKVAGPEEIESALKRMGLESDLIVKKYSLGMKQKLNIVQAIFENPQIVLLDEPTNALDDEAIVRLQHILQEEKERGACILIATHNKQEIANQCDKILGIKDGALCEL